MLFAIVLHPLVLQLQRLLASSNTEDQELAYVLIQIWYLDNGYIVARHDLLQKAIHLLSSADATGRGLHFNLSKCKVWWPTPPHVIVQENYPSQLKQDYSEGTLILNAPVGSQPYMESYFTDHVRSLQPLLDSIANLEDVHVAFQLLRNCFGFCRISHLLRVVPPASTANGSSEFGGMM